MASCLLTGVPSRGHCYIGLVSVGYALTPVSIFPEKTTFGEEVRVGIAVTGSVCALESGTLEINCCRWSCLLLVKKTVSAVTSHVGSAYHCGFGGGGGDDEDR